MMAFPKIGVSHRVILTDLREVQKPMECFTFQKAIHGVHWACGGRRAAELPVSAEKASTMTVGVRLIYSDPNPT